LNVTASEPLADARSHPRKPRCNVELFEYELTGEELKPSFEQTQLQALISQIVVEEVSRQIAEKDAEIDRLKVELKCERRERKALETKLEDLQATTAQERAYDRQRIARLEKRPQPVSSTTANAHINRLHEQMIRFGSKQVTVNEAARLIGISKPHMKKIKQHLVVDSRFAIVKDPHHKQRHLIRLI